jgi:hypothetical protein
MGMKLFVTIAGVVAASAAGWFAAGGDAAIARSASVAAPIHPRTPVFCYVETIFGGATAADLDFRPCTHVIEAFVTVDALGTIAPQNGLPRRDVIAAARKAGARVMVAIGGSTVPGSTFATIGRDPVVRDRFTGALATFVVTAGYDGVDVDWEFPSPADADVNLSLVRAIRGALVRASRSHTRTGHLALAPPIVTVPVAAYWIPDYNLAALQEEVDAVILMGYDFRNPALGPWANDAKLWPVNASTPIEGSVRGAAAEMIRNGLGFDKLIIALPFYSSVNQPWVDIRTRALASPAVLHPLFLEKQIDDVWITDPEALERKITAALAGYQIAGGNAAGIAIWQLGHQGRFHELTDALLRATLRP